MDDILVRIKILMDVLDKKIELLTTIYNITENQETILKLEDFPDKNSFLNESMGEKQKLIDEVIIADDVFQSMYDQIKDHLKADTQQYKDFIINMQIRIKDIMDFDIRIRVKEERNRALMTTTLPNPKFNIMRASKKHVLDQYTKNSKKR